MNQMRGTLVTSLVLLAACGGGSDSTGPAAEGSLVIQTATDGHQVDANGYTLAVTGNGSVAIGVNASVRHDHLTPGDYSATLSGLATNCHTPTLTDTAHVIADGVDSIVFAVSCDTTLGRLRVNTATGGHELDPSGFTVVIDGLSGHAIGLTDSVTVADLPAGQHIASLTGVAGNCHAPKLADTTAVPAGGIGALSFAITCDTTHGTIVVHATTGGGTPDPDGYGILVGGVASGTVGTNAYQTTPQLPTGTKVVTLTDLAVNCAVTAPAADTVVITPGGTDTVSFAVSCPTPAIVVLSSTTTGPAPDPDGYSILVDSGVAHPLGANAAADTIMLPPGAHTLSFGGAVANCTLTGSGFRAFALAEGAVDNETFNVECTAPRVAVARDIPGKSYGLFLINADGTNPTNILPFESTGGARAPSWSPDRHEIAFQKSSHDQGTALEIVQADGTGLHSVFDSLGVTLPRWSPKGDRILFAYHPAGSLSPTTTRIWVVDTSGTNAAPLLTDSLGEFSADWSPSGDSVVLHRYAANGSASGNTEVIILDLTTDSVSTLIPASTNSYATQGARWSPTGDRIAYRCGTLVVCTVGVHDNSVATSNLPDLLVGPLTWSPDATSILGGAQCPPLGNLCLMRIVPGIDGWTTVTTATIDPDWK